MCDFNWTFSKRIEEDEEVFLSCCIKYCIFRRSNTGATTILESPRNIVCQVWCPTLKWRIIKHGITMQPKTTGHKRKILPVEERGHGIAKGAKICCILFHWKMVTLKNHSLRSGKLLGNLKLYHRRTILEGYLMTISQQHLI